MIKIDHVSHAYRHNQKILQSLNDISLEVGDEFLTVVGPSGSGKSTLLKVLAGFEKPTSGTVTWTGTPNVAMVFQDYSLLPWLSVRSNIELYARLQGRSAHDSSGRSTQLLEQLGLATYADLLPHELSGGMQQRVAIGRALAQAPDLLLMDEPFGALDAMTRSEAQSVLLRVHAERRCAVVFVTHDVEEALILSDRIVVLTARPAKVLEILRVPFQRPRDQELRWGREFTELRRGIVSTLHRQATADQSLGPGKSGV